MYIRKILFLTLVAAVIAGTSLSANAQGRTLLGTRDVRSTVDHDRISVTSSRGSFHRIKFKVAKHSIGFIRVVVHYGNGTSERLALRQEIPAGGESRWIRLAGEKRVINHIDFWYNSKSLLGHGARIWVYGER